MTDSTASIKILTFGESVRKRSGMYVGDPGPAMLQHLIDELASNAIDQFLRGNASFFAVRIHADNTIEVSDDGAGLPFDRPAPNGEGSLATHCLLHTHHSARADDEAPHVHVHFQRGVGLAVVNHLSSRFVCRSWRGGRLWEQRFVAGVAESPPQVLAEGEGRGTTFLFQPIAEIVGVESPDRGLLRATLWRAAHLFAGVKIQCGDETFHAPGGLGDYLRALEDPASTAVRRWNDRPVFHWRGRHGDYQIDAAASGIGDAGRECQWRSWVNGRSTPQQGSHVRGFELALQALDWMPATAMLHLTTYDPQFAGPTRDRYVSAVACKTVRKALAPALDAFCRAQKIGIYAAS